MDEHTAVICVSHVQYATGHRLDPAGLVELARSVDATLVLDATQSAGVVPLDAAALGVDVLVSSGYKWLCSAPGAGICYLRPELWEQLDPLFVGWKSTEDAFAFDARVIPLAQSARRLEYSTPAYAAGAALTAAVDYLLDLGIENVLEHDLALVAELIAGLERFDAEVRLRPRTSAGPGSSSPASRAATARRSPLPSPTRA